MVLDLFSGLGGWSQAFKDRGHSIITIDNEPKFKPTICRDIMELKPDYFKDDEGININFDIVLASPPCNCFSVASVYRHWDKDTKKPKDEATRQAIRLIGHTLNLIMNIQPRFWILENPRGMLRRVLGPPAVTTYFASWATEEEISIRRAAIRDYRPGSRTKKPTDLWGVIPKGIKWKEPKEWLAAPRGSSRGTQGLKDAALRAKIPYELSKVICLACEKEILGVKKGGA